MDLGPLILKKLAIDKSTHDQRAAAAKNMASKATNQYKAYNVETFIRDGFAVTIDAWFDKKPDAKVFADHARGYDGVLETKIFEGNKIVDGKRVGPSYRTFVAFRLRR